MSEPTTPATTSTGPTPPTDDTPRDAPPPGAPWLRALLARYRFRFLAAALALLAAWEVTVLLRARATAATEDDWQRAAGDVASGFAPGDLVVFAPAWVDPVGRQHLGHLLTVADAARMDAVRYGRIWEVSIRGAEAPEVAGLRPTSVAQHGRVRVRHFVRPAPEVTWDLRARSTLEEVDFTPRRCLRLRELRADSPPAKVTFPGVPLGDTLAVAAGLTDFRARKENHGVALVRLLVDGQEVSRAEIGPDSGWVHLPPAPTTPGPHTVEIEAQVVPGRGTPVKLPVCVAAEARRTRTAESR